MTTFGGPVEVVYFEEALPGTGATQLAAAVAWRGAPGGAPRAGHGLVARLLRLRHRLWLRFGPLGVDLRLRGSRPRAGGGGSFGPDGARATYYDSDRRAVHVRDGGRLAQAYPLPPPGHTLVLLVDEGARAAAARVTVRTVAAPVVPAEPQAFGTPALGPDPAEARRADAMATARAAWTAALRADPEVRAFLDGDAGPTGSA